jgi:hypothetical protein
MFHAEHFTKSKFQKDEHDECLQQVSSPWKLTFKSVRGALCAATLPAHKNANKTVFVPFVFES